MAIDLWTVFNIPKPGSLGSAAPGTGPTQQDTPISAKPQSQGGPVIAPSQSPNALGYGGGGDTVQISPGPRGAPMHAGPLNAAQSRMPPLALMGPPKPIVPRFTQLYDTLRSRDAWRYIADQTVKGTITAAASGATASAVVTLPSAANLRVSQWPGAIQAYLVIRYFGLAPQVTTATGEFSVYFIDTGGVVVPLGEIIASGSANLTNVTLVPTPLIDPNVTSLGTLYMDSNATTGTPVCNWRFGFTFVYLLPDPQFRGYLPDSPSLAAMAQTEAEASLRRN